MKGMKQDDGSTIWEDGSRTYAAATGKAKDPPTTWPYPPKSGTPVEIADETPAQASPGPRPHILLPLGANPTPDAIFAKWQEIVREWACLAQWAGGLDALATKIGAPIYAVSGTSAMGLWKKVLDDGYGKATSYDDLTNGAFDLKEINIFVGQLSDTVTLARAKGYPGCPAPPPAVHVIQPPTAPQTTRPTAPAPSPSPVTNAPSPSPAAQVNEPSSPKLYVSLDGTERSDWRRRLTWMAAAVFASGALIGAGVAGAVTSKKQPET